VFWKLVAAQGQDAEGATLAFAFVLDDTQGVDALVEYINANAKHPAIAWPDLPARVKPVARWGDFSEVAELAGFDPSAFAEFATGPPPSGVGITLPQLDRATPKTFQLDLG
jgi:hypothetical protein